MDSAFDRDEDKMTEPTAHLTEDPPIEAADKSSEGESKAKEMLDKVKDKASDLVDKVKDKLHHND